jgi:hypothetical protein
VLYLEFLQVGIFQPLRDVALEILHRTLNENLSIDVQCHNYIVDTV